MTGLFEGVPKEELDALLARMPRCGFPAGSVAVAPGDRPPGVYVIRSGSAERDGAPLGPGATFGEDAVATGAAAAATVRAVEGLDTVQVRRRDLDLIAYAFPAVAQRVGLTEPGEQPGRIVLLEDEGAPLLAAHALASEVSRHAGRRALLLVVGPDSAPELERLAVSRVELVAAGPRTDPGVDVLLQPPETLGEILAGLAVVYEHAFAFGRELPEVEGARRIALDAAPSEALARELAQLVVGIAGRQDALEPLGVVPDIVAETAGACERQGAHVVVDVSGGGEPAATATVVTLSEADPAGALPRLAAALPWLRTPSSETVRA